MKKVGITGPSGSGKSTLWRAVTGGETKGDVATVGVPDPRLDTLVQMHTSLRRVPAKIEVIDIHETARTASAATARLRDVPS